jgi:hypothetical protein
LEGVLFEALQELGMAFTFMYLSLLAQFLALQADAWTGHGEI